MSKLNGLLHESEKAKERLEQAIVSGDYDEMTAIERSQVELSRRIFFARRDDFAEQLNDLRIEKQSAVELAGELAEQLNAAAAVVLDLRSKLYDAQCDYAAITQKQFFIDNQLENNRQETNRVNGLLAEHIKSRLSGVNGSNQAIQIDLMENDICELLPN